MNPLSAEWIEKAEGDYKVALRESQSQDPVCDALCFHAQQCVEKYLKAWLTEQTITFPKTHDLDSLITLAGDTLNVSSDLHHKINLLTDSAIETRYPGTTTDWDDGQICLSTMNAVRDLIRSNLKL